MTQLLKHRTTEALLLLSILAGYWGILIWQMSAQWAVYEQYHYGWFVPLLCLYLLWRRRTGVKGQRSEVSMEGGEGLRRRSTEPALFLAVSLLLYIPTRFFHEANPTWRLTSLLMALEVIGITLSLIQILTTPLRTQASVGRSTEALKHQTRFVLTSDLSPLTSAFTFPVLFFLVAVPWPSALEGFLAEKLMHWNASATVECLCLYGIPAAQHGNVIEVSSGIIGIDEACGGIRSLQATLMISLFFGEFYRLNFRRRIFCVIMGFGLACAFNLGRTLLLVSIGSAQGVHAMERWHDLAGVAILVGCFLALWLVAVLQRLELRDQRSEVKGPALRTGGDTERAKHRSAVPLTSALASLLLTELGTQTWYRLHESPSANPNWGIQFPVNDARYQTKEIAKTVRDQFRFDRGFEGRWQNDDGAVWHLYYFRWNPSRSLNNRVSVRLAKSHGPEKCLPASGMKLRADLGPVLLEGRSRGSEVRDQRSEVVVSGDVTDTPSYRTTEAPAFKLSMRQYVFETRTRGQILHVFYGIYEDSSGSEELANRGLNAKDRIRAALCGRRDYGQRFLEIAVSGYETAEKARGALERELPVGQ